MKSWNFVIPHSKKILLFWTKFFSMLHYCHLTWKLNGCLMSPCMQPAYFYLIYILFLLQIRQFLANLLYIFFLLHMTQSKLQKTTGRLRQRKFSSYQHSNSWYFGKNKKRIIVGIIEINFQLSFWNVRRLYSDYASDDSISSHLYIK